MRRIRKKGPSFSWRKSWWLVALLIAGLGMIGTLIYLAASTPGYDLPDHGWMKAAIQNAPEIKGLPLPGAMVPDTRVAYDIPEDTRESYYSGKARWVAVYHLPDPAFDVEVGFFRSLEWTKLGFAGFSLAGGTPPPAFSSIGEERKLATAGFLFRRGRVTVLVRSAPGETGPGLAQTAERIDRALVESFGGQP